MLLHHLSILDKQQGGDTANAILERNLRVIIYIELADGCLSLIFL